LERLIAWVLQKGEWNMEYEFIGTFRKYKDEEDACGWNFFSCRKI